MKKSIILSIFCACIISQIAYAHPPQSMQANFDSSTKILSLTIKHWVRDPSSHYIQKVVITRGGKEIASQSFSQQDSKTAQTVSLTLSQVEWGDMVYVTAYCNIGGKLVKKVSISGGVSESSDEKPYNDGEYVGKSPTIDVKVTIGEGKISAIEILRHRSGGQEYEDMIQPLTTEIVNQQSADVDAVTGATVSSEALKDAVNNALHKAQR